MTNVVWWRGDHIAVYNQNPIRFQGMTETIDRILGLSHEDVRALLKAMLKASVLRFFLDPFYWFRRPAHPGDF